MRLIQTILFCLCVTFTQANFLAIAHDAHKPRLIFALDLVRHGDRAPVRYIPEISTAWPEHEIGNLTNIGETTAEALGKKLRHYYVDETHLLPSHFDPHLIYVRATDKSRTKKTATAILKGLYPAEASQKLIVPALSEDVLNTENYAQARAAAIGNIMGDIAKADAQLGPAIDQMIKRINKLLGTNFSHLEDAVVIGDVIGVSKIHNKPITKKLPSNVIKKISQIFNRILLGFSASPTMSCIYGKASIMHISDMLSSHPNHKYALYVAHDANIRAITHLLDARLKNIPPYLSDLRFEIFQNAQGQALVRVSLDGRVIKVCSESDYCPLEKFEKQVRENVARTCTVKPTSALKAH